MAQDTETGLRRTLFLPLIALYGQVTSLELVSMC